MSSGPEALDAAINVLAHMLHGEQRAAAGSEQGAEAVPATAAPAVPSVSSVVEAVRGAAGSKRRMQYVM